MSDDPWVRMLAGGVVGLLVGIAVGAVTDVAGNQMRAFEQGRMRERLTHDYVRAQMRSLGTCEWSKAFAKRMNCEAQP